MFRDVAKKLLKLMGKTGSIPGGVHAAEVPRALETLRAGLAETADEEPGPDNRDDDEEERPVSLSVRAYPLLRLLEQAAAEDCAVSWSADADDGAFR